MAWCRGKSECPRGLSPHDDGEGACMPIKILADLMRGRVELGGGAGAEAERHGELN